MCRTNSTWASFERAYKDEGPMSVLSSSTEAKDGFPVSIRWNSEDWCTSLLSGVLSRIGRSVIARWCCEMTLTCLDDQIAWSVSFVLIDLKRVVKDAVRQLTFDY